nr:YgiQ family radical SAM protein [Polynucleobacter sp. 30F-ANTBAC]
MLIPSSPRLDSYPKYWAECFGTAPFLPMSREEMDQLGWDSCDIIIVTGDAYVDHPSFGMAIIGRLLEAQGFRVGIIAQPDWQSADPFKTLGRPNLFYGVAAGNMDSMINRYTADRKVRSDDAYTPGGIGGKRPDRCSLVYAQRCREAYPEVPIVMGGIEASLRRIAHYDYWQDKVRRSILIDAKADILLYGNAERAVVEIAHRLAKGEAIGDIIDIRGTAFVRRHPAPGFTEIDSSTVDEPGVIDAPINPYLTPDEQAKEQGTSCKKTDGTLEEPASIEAPAVQAITVVPSAKKRLERDTTVIRLPSYEAVKRDPVLYAHANRVLHLETNPGNARALVQQHGEGASIRDVWLNQPAVPLTTEEMDSVFDLPYARAPHPSYGDAKIPAWDMIRFSVNIMRGCFGGCTFCSITEHEGRIIQNRSSNSIIKEIEDIRDKVPGFTGIISDLGGPTANMYRIACKSREIEAHCRKPSCVYPDICPNLNTDHTPLIQLYRRARALPGIKKILIGSGVRYDLAVKAPAYIKELVSHHVGGYLKIAPEHTEQGPLSKMMKPGMGAYDKFKELFDKYSKEAGKEQFLIPYFIAAHPGTSDEDMMHLAIWLKKNGFRADQVQTFYPSPMATATAMYHTNKNPLRKVTRDSETVDIVRGEKRRRLHKAFLRYHDANNWPLLREALKKMGRADLIGNGKHHLIPNYQPNTDGTYQSPRRKNSYLGKSSQAAEAHNPRDFSVPQKPVRGQILTQHTGLPPRAGTKAATPGGGRPMRNGIQAIKAAQGPRSTQGSQGTSSNSRSPSARINPRSKPGFKK